MGNADVMHPSEAERGRIRGKALKTGLAIKMPAFDNPAYHTRNQEMELRLVED